MTIPARTVTKTRAGRAGRRRNKASREDWVAAGLAVLGRGGAGALTVHCLLYTSDAADE